MTDAVTVPEPEALPEVTRQSRSQLKDVLIALALLLLSAVVYRAALDRQDRRHNPDEGLYAGVAAFANEGDVSWGETIVFAGNRHFHQSVYAFSDATFGHYNTMALGFLHSLLVGLAAWLFGLAGQRMLGFRSARSVLALGAVYVLLSYTLYEGEANNSEHMANVFVGAFICLWALAIQYQRPGVRLAAFTALGCAWLTKMQLFPLVLCAPCFWWLYLRTERPGVAGFAKEMVASAMAFLVFPVLQYVVFSMGEDSGTAAVGSETLRFLFEYPLLDGSERFFKTWERMSAHIAPVPIMCLALLASLGSIVGPLLLRSDEAVRHALRPARALGTLYLLLLASTIGGYHLYSHYFLMALPVAILCCAHAIVFVTRERSVPPRLMALVLVVWGLISGPVHYASLRNHDLPADVLISAWVRYTVPVEERIFVWGWAPHLYLLSKRVPASRQTSCSYVVNDYEVPDLPPSHEGRLASLLADLERWSPRVILKPRHMNWAFDPRRYEVERVPPFKAFLEKHYQKPVVVYDHEVYLLR